MLLPARREDVPEAAYGIRMTMLGIHAGGVDDNFVHAGPTVFGQPWRGALG